MKFQEFWKRLHAKLTQENEFKTLKQNKKFEVHLEYIKQELVVIVTPESSMIPRQIPINEFEWIWNNARGLSRETRFENNDRQIESYTTKKGEVGRSIQIPYITKLIDCIVQDQDME